MSVSRDIIACVVVFSSHWHGLSQKWTRSGVSLGRVTHHISVVIAWVLSLASILLDALLWIQWRDLWAKPPTGCGITGGLLTASVVAVAMSHVK